MMVVSPVTIMSMISVLIMMIPVVVPMPMPMTMVMLVSISVPMHMVMPVPMIMVVPVAPLVIGLERRRHFRGLQPVLGHQRFDLGPFLQPDPVGEDLHRDVAVAERQDEARDRGEVLGAHLDHRLDVGHDFGEPAVVEHQEVVGAQARRLREIELDARALAAEHEALLPAAVIELQQQRVGDLARLRAARCLLRRPAAQPALGENFLRARHV